MANRQLAAFLNALGDAALRQDGAGLTDSELLDRFIARRDQAAFEALVRRHGPMVLGVCQRILWNEADAEDAFQATFLVLVRKAASVRPRGMVGNWLYGVAHNTARNAKAMKLRRRMKEREAGAMSRQAAAEEAWGELRAILDRALPALHDKYRTPTVLCDLEGMTIREAARQLGWPQGTVATRLARGRTLLARRLADSRLSLSLGALALALAQGSASADMPTALVGSTVEAATAIAASQVAAAAVISAEVAALTQGVLKTMLLNKLKVATAVLAGVLACVGGATVVLLPMAAGQQKVQATTQKAFPEDKKTDKEKLQGTWVAVSAERNGAKIDSDDPGINSTKWTFDGDKVTMSPLKEEPCPYTLDPDKSPKEMDIDVGDGKKDEKLLTIYKFEGGRLKWHWVKDGPRPSDFDTSKSKGVVIVFEKKKQ
jgi:RNA polymerase sigma-70 factor (ECF subfamily)